METVITEDGHLSLDHLPFRAGQTVEVILLPLCARVVPADGTGLQGTVLQHQRPTDPVAEDDWEALQ